MHQASLRGDLARAENCFNQLIADPGFVVEPSTINTLIQSAANMGNFQAAEAWFGKLLDYKLNATVASYTAVITAAAKNRKQKEAEEWFEAMQYDQIMPDTAAYGSVMSACANAGDVSRTESYFQRMIVHGLKLNPIIFGTVTLLPLIPTGWAKLFKTLDLHLACCCKTCPSRTFRLKLITRSTVI